MTIPPALRRAFRAWLIHWLTAVALSFLFFFLLKPLAGTALFETLDHLGGDAVVRIYGGGPEPHAPILLVDLGPDPTFDILAQALTQLAPTHPRAIGLDHILKPPPPTPDGASDPRVTRLRQAIASLGDTPVALPIGAPSLAEALRALPNIREASVELVRDDDGTVRTTQDRACAHNPTGRVTLPTLAAAIVGDDHHLGKAGGCTTHAETRPILFAPLHMLPSPAGKGIQLISLDQLATQGTLPTGAYVILGVVGSDANTDAFPTPLGLYPGAVIHAEAVWTLAAEGATHWTRSVHHILHPAFEMMFGLVSAAILAVFTAARGEKHAIASHASAIRRFGWGILLIAVSLLVFCFLGWVWTYTAVLLMREGVVIGAVTAVFGSMLETLVDAGDDIVGPIHWAIARKLKKEHP